MHDLADRIAGWISREVERSGMKGAVVGLSGGLDSAVVASLLERALGDRALAVILPCESSPRDVEHAALVAGSIGIEATTVDLDAAFECLAGVLPEGPKLARANLKPRLRMTVLYYFANRLSYLVAGTGNRSEIMLGYFTKFGDGAADFLPLGELYKTEVRELARELGIPKEVIDKPPSAGLWEGQTDEGELGMSYEEIDRALRAVESGGAGGVEREVLDRVKRLVESSLHKRSPAPSFELDRTDSRGR